MTRKVLVTGATGNIGSQLTPRLAAHDGLEVRAYVRDAEKAAQLRDAGAKLAIGTFEDAGSLRTALKDIDTVVLITPPGPNAADQAIGVVDAAKEAGVRRIVRISALKASVDGPTDNTRQHGRTDEAILSSGLAYTILRPHFFMQNLFMSAQTIATDGNMFWGMGDGKLGTIDVRDIVDSAEKAVLSDEFDNHILSLTGPETLSFHDMASRLTKILGRPVTYVPVSLDAVEQSLRDMGMGDWFPKVMRDYSGAYSRGWGDFTDGDVERVTGHAARSFDEFARQVLAPALGHGN